MKKQFPLTLEQVLRLWMPKERHPDREKIYRQYLKVRLSEDGRQTLPPPSDDEVVAILSKKRRDWFTETKIENMTPIFQNWYDGFKARIRKNRAATAARKRWKKD